MICNSTPLILLSKINQLEILKDIFGFVLIPESVKDEVLIEDKPGFIIIKKAIENNWIKIINPKKKLDLNLGNGEIDAISLAKEKKDTLIIDDSYAIKAARIYNVDTIRTTTVIFTALKKKIINKKQAIELINKLIENDYYIKPTEYSIILNKLNENKT